MKRRNAGFTIVEMLIVMAIFGLVMSGTAQLFVTILRVNQQQSRITETNIEGIIGLELLRQDLGKAGLGLPWNATAGFNYAEKATDTFTLNDAPSNAPRGIVSADNVAATGGILDGTDYLVIKAANVATDLASNKWTFLLTSGTTVSWSSASENLRSTDHVIVLSMGSTNQASARNLESAAAADALFSGVASFATDSNDTKIIYGIDSDALRMPFNRADYFVMRPSSSDMPRRCAAQTGNLYKGVVNQNGGLITSYMHLLDCVADMQVVFRRDLDSDGAPENWSEDISGLSASDLRTQVKEVRVFILAHEGQIDRNYQYGSSTIRVGDPSPYNNGRLFDLTTIPGWQYYRWKVYTLVVKLDNLS